MEKTNAGKGMQKNNTGIGKEGEDYAARWLEKEGYEILHRNWRYRRYEIDIIARRAEILHFIEVKARQWNAFGYPEESVSPKKIRNMMRAAVAWRIRFPGAYRTQYDVLAITIRPGGEPEYFFFGDVYV